MGAGGTNGLKRIKKQNGLTFAQDPREAEHDSMPRHAIDTGLIDFVLPVAEIPSKLIEIWRNASRIELPSPTEPSAINQENTDEAALREILTILRANTGHDFAYYKRATVLRRIERRLQINQLQNIWAYLELVRASAEETESLLKDLLISVTNFFRDRTAFEEFERAVVPLLFQDKSSADTVRV